MNQISVLLLIQQPLTKERLQILLNQTIVGEVLCLVTSEEAGTHQEMQAWSEEHESCRYFDLTGFTQAEAWNEGLQQAQQEYLTFLTADQAFFTYQDQWEQAEWTQAELVLAATKTAYRLSPFRESSLFLEASPTQHLYRRSFLTRYQLCFLNTKDALVFFQWMSFFAAQHIASVAVSFPLQALNLTIDPCYVDIQWLLEAAEIRPLFQECLKTLIFNDWFLAFHEQYQNLGFSSFQQKTQAWKQLGQSWQVEEMTLSTEAWILWEALLHRPKQAYLLWTQKNLPYASYFEKRAQKKQRPKPTYFGRFVPQGDEIKLLLALPLSCKTAKLSYYEEGAEPKWLSLSCQKVGCNQLAEVNLPYANFKAGTYFFNLFVDEKESSLSTPTKKVRQGALVYEFRSQQLGVTNLALPNSSVEKTLYAVNKEGSWWPVHTFSDLKQAQRLLALKEGQFQALHLEETKKVIQKEWTYTFTTADPHVRVSQQSAPMSVLAQQRYFLCDQAQDGDSLIFYDLQQQNWQRYVFQQKKASPRWQSLKSPVYRLWIYKQKDQSLAPVTLIDEKQNSRGAYWQTSPQKQASLWHYIKARCQKVQAQQIYLKDAEERASLQALAQHLHQAGYKVYYDQAAAYSKEALQYLGRAKFILSTVDLPTFCQPRKGQVWWKIEQDASLQKRGFVTPKYQALKKKEEQALLREKARFQTMIVPRQAVAEQIRSDWKYKGRLQCLPSLVQSMLASLQQQTVKERYGLASHQKIGLLACSLSRAEVQTLPKDYLYLAQHPEQVQGDLQVWPLASFVYEEALALADFCVTDQAQLACDYQSLGRPCYLLASTSRQKIKEPLPSVPTIEIALALWTKALVEAKGVSHTFYYGKEKGQQAIHWLYEKLFTCCSLLPKKNCIIFESFYGEKYADNPKALYEYIQAHYPEWTCIWNAKKGYEDVFKKAGVPYVVNNTLAALWVQSRAKYWIYNTRLVAWKQVPRHTRLLQTWHGTPWKHLGLDIEEVHLPGVSTEQYYEEFLADTNKWSCLLAPNAYAFSVFQSAFQLPAEKIILTGYPRNDTLTQTTTAEQKRLKKALGLPEDKKVILYAPTWRDDQNKGQGQYECQIHLNIARWKEAFPDAVLLIRAHYFIHHALVDDGTFVFDVSTYQDINDLYKVSDVLITDYSSVFFDYALLQRPMIFYAYDEAQYLKHRGAYFSYSEVPGPIVKTEAKLIAAVRQALSEKHLARPYIAQMSSYTKEETGHSSQRAWQYFSQGVEQAWKKDASFLPQQLYCNGRGYLYGDCQEQEKLQKLSTEVGVPLEAKERWYYYQNGQRVGQPKYYVQKETQCGFVNAYQVTVPIE